MKRETLTKNYINENKEMTREINETNKSQKFWLVGNGHFLAKKNLEYVFREKKTYTKEWAKYQNFFLNNKRCVRERNMYKKFHNILFCKYSSISRNLCSFYLEEID